MKRLPIFFLASISFLGCHSGSSQNHTTPNRQSKALVSNASSSSFDTSVSTIHVLVALCDNKYQGIVPVPAAIGNGQDPNNNLYWGCSAGIRTYFKKSREWEMIKKCRIDSVRLERVVFRHKMKNYYLVADAYDGRYIRNCTIDFLRSCSGENKDTVQIAETILGINGNAKLISYIGHDGLMDFTLNEGFQNSDGVKRDAIILACISKKYFAPFLLQTQSNPLIWTTGLMCPEAYTLHDALTSYISNESSENIRSKAAKAYAKNQKCSEKAARNLLVSGW